MSIETLPTYTYTPEQLSLAKRIKGFGFQWYLLRNLPIGLLVGLAVEKLEPETCITSVPFRWLNKNPFQSIYFAVLSMAAELSTAANCMLAVQAEQPTSVAFIIINTKATFHKKATGKISFTCKEGLLAHDTVKRCAHTKEPGQITLKTEGKNESGEVVASFEFTWSFKVRS